MKNNQLNFDEKLAFLDFVGINFKEGSVLVSNQSLFKRNAPKLKFNKDEQLFTLYLSIPKYNDDYGRLSFDFDEITFLQAYNMSKYKNEQSKFLYTSFDDAFFKPLFYQSNNSIYKDVVRYAMFTFSFFDVNPTNLNKAITLSISKPNNKLNLNPNLKKINHYVFDVNNYKGRPKGSKNPLQSISYDGVSKCIEFFMKNDFKGNLGLKTLKSCVEEAAKCYDVAKCFPKFYETALYYVFDDAKPNPKLYSLILKKFHELVDKLQKGVL